MRAIVTAARGGELAAEPRLVISNNLDSEAVAFAGVQHLPWRHISAATEGSPQAADRAVADALQAAGVELVVLSGYMRKLGPETLSRYRGRILNIHPALLPKYGGRGMYGRRVHEAVRASGDTITGASIHLVDNDYDTGPVIARAEVPIGSGDSVDDIEARVRSIEPGLYVDTLRQIAGGSLILPAP